MTIDNDAIINNSFNTNSSSGKILYTNAHIACSTIGASPSDVNPSSQKADAAYDSGQLYDVYIEQGRFHTITPHTVDQSNMDTHNKAIEQIPIVDVQGKLICPPFCDTHLHLDYVFTARKPGAQNNSGTLFEGIQRWSETKHDLTVNEVKERAKIGIAKEIMHGVQYIRTHADVTDDHLTSLRALLELKEELQDIVQLQIVSFPQEGMFSYVSETGTNGSDLVEEGLRLGADCVGGIPHFEQCREFGERSIHRIVQLATKYNKRIDVHCDETDDPQSRYIELLAALTYHEGIGNQTTASHTCSLGSADNAYFFHLMKLLKSSHINFAVAPTENLYLQGRQDTYPKRRGITRVKELVEAGINVSLGQDSMQDPWYPLGNGNMMIILDYLLHVSQLMSFEEIDHALQFLTTNGAKTLGIENQYGIKVGNPANFIVLNASDEFQAVYERATVLRSVREGRTLFTRTETFHSDYHVLSI